MGLTVKNSVFGIVLIAITLVISSLIWNTSFASFFVFVDLTPLFLGVYLICKNNKIKWYYLLLFIYLFKLVLVFCQMFWLKDVTFDTFYLAVFTHSFFFVLILTPSVLLLRAKNKMFIMYYIIATWMVFEYLMQNFPLLSPFYLLGTTIGDHPFLIQSYSLIGVEGGSLWILLTNFFVFKLILALKNKTSFKKSFLQLIIVFFAPIIVGQVYQLLITNKDANKIEVAALHVHFNPVNYNYALHPDEVIDSLWNLSKGVSKDAQLMVWPETVITSLGWFSEFDKNPYVDSLQKKLITHPNLTLVFGANLYSVGNDSSDQQLNYDPQNNYYYYVHNLAFSLSSEKSIVYRSKEVFVPFQEQIPYVNFFPILKKLITVVGNPNYYAELKNDMDVHRLLNGGTYSPLLCYEICYPIFTAQMSDDAGFIVLSGNEHWNTSENGSRIYYNILKAIAAQNACPIVKSSNNGVSAIIDGNGYTMAKKAFDDTGIISAKINLREKSTFYSYIAGYTSVLALLALPILIFKGRKKD
ncbi:MAG: hypothetical protein M9916_03010 [Crocinitomicaceae bacterium]|nr:hypothetical protein [Crocinitomicaceae bacterium]